MEAALLGALAPPPLAVVAWAGPAADWRPRRAGAAGARQVRASLRQPAEPSPRPACSARSVEASAILLAGAALWRASELQPRALRGLRARGGYRRFGRGQLGQTAGSAGLRRGRSLLPLRSLADDLSLASEELLNTVEDAALHVNRLGPWLSGGAPPHEAGGEAPEAGAAGLEDAAEAARPRRRRVIILGTGWAAHAIAKVVDLEANDVLIVSPRNYFVFTPMLAAASVGTVEYRSILEHIRSANPILRFYQGACEAIDAERHEITVRPVAKSGADAPFAIPYDTLVVAVGLRPNARGVPGVYENCLFLKSIEDARTLRTRVTECFERADLPTASDEDRRRLLTFVVVGGGPTGCELCGELSDFLRNELRRFYPRLAPLVRIFLVHRGKTILPSFGEDLQRAARETLTSQGIEVMTCSQVSSVGSSSITIKSVQGGEERTLSCGMCVWSAGNRSQDIAESLRQQLPAQLEAAGAPESNGPVLVDEWLRVLGVPDGSILALGDCAQVAGAPPLPQTAQVAAQQGAYVARLLNRRYDLASPGPPSLPPEAELPRLVRARGQTEAPQFRFLDLGRLAYLGEDKAVAEVSLGQTAVSSAAGLAAFVLWRSVYVVKQVSFRNRVLVLFDWVKSKVFGRDLTRF